MATLNLLRHNHPLSLSVNGNNNMNRITPPSFKTIALRIEQHVAWVALNRPAQANAIDDTMWKELQACFEWIDSEVTVRVAVLCGEGKNFCGGLDLAYFSDLGTSLGQHQEPARRVEAFRQIILTLQGHLTAIERCRKPVIAAIQGSCVGGGVDMVSCCDMRYCCDGAKFSIKEIDVGLVADVGTLQRLPHIIPRGLMNELTFTGRNMLHEEAERAGMVNKSYQSYEVMIEEVSALAQEIARKSPLAVRGAKEILRYSRDHSVDDALNYVATWNAGMLSMEDVMAAVSAATSGEAAEYKD